MNDSMNQFMNNDYQSLADYLFSFSGNEFAILSCIIAFAISQNLTPHQLSSLGNFFESIGQFMLTKGAQEQIIQDKRENKY